MSQPSWVRTAHGVTVVAAPRAQAGGEAGARAISVEAWLGGGAGDETPGQDGLAHLAEHVAIAASEAGAGGELVRRGGAVDGWVTPDATAIRALAPPGHLDLALAAIMAACTAADAPPELVESERDQVAVEIAAGRRQPRAAAAAALWARAFAGHPYQHGVGGVPPIRLGGPAVTGWWRRSWTPARTTIAVDGAELAPVAARVGRWPHRPPVRTARGSFRRVPPVGEPHASGPWAVGVPVPGAADHDLAALALLTAAVRPRVAELWPGADAVELVVLARAGMWIASGVGPAPDPAAVAAALARIPALAAAGLSAARASAVLPVPGTERRAGQLAAGHHLVGDPGWADRVRAGMARASVDHVVGAARRHLRASRALVTGGASARVAQAGPAARGARPGPAATARTTLADGTRVIATRVPGVDGVAVRVAWPGGFAIEEPGVRGVTSVLAATLPAVCDGRVVADRLAELGGSLTGVAGRWTFGLRSRWPAASWRDGLALIADCVRAPRLGRVAIEHETVRLRELAAAVAASPTRTAFRTYQQARWGDHPLGRDPLGDPADLADLERADVARWWTQHYPPGAAVIAVAGDVDPATALAAVESALAVGTAPAPARATAPRPAIPPLPAARELFVDGPPGTSAVVIGFPGLAATDPDRTALDHLAALLDGPHARLRRELAARAPVRSLRAIVVAGPDAGYLAVELVGGPPLDAAVEVVAEVAGDLAAGGPRDDELTAAPGATPAADLEQRADQLALAALGLTAPAGPPPDRAALARVAAALLRWDEAVIATVRPPHHSPAVDEHLRRPVRRRPARTRPARRGRGRGPR